MCLIWMGCDDLCLSNIIKHESNIATAFYIFIVQPWSENQFLIKQTFAYVRF